jgi:hypothetical protein
MFNEKLKTSDISERMIQKLKLVFKRDPGKKSKSETI